MDLFDSKTGEVLEIREKPIPFRSITDLKGYDHCEHYEPGTSDVDLTGYEPLESIIARCTRTMRAPGGQVYQVLDMDAVKQEAEVVPSSADYDAANAKTLDEAFDSEDPTSDPDFDLADASRILNRVETTLSTSSDDKRGGVALHVANDDERVIERVVEKSANDDEEADEIDTKAKKA